jgi:FO synthase
MGFSSTIDYLVECCHLVLQHTSLLPHANPGVCSPEEMGKLREATVSQGIMLESLATHLLLPGAPHHRSPDKAPNRRLQVLETAGELRVPFTTGLLIGIGESRLDRLEALAAIRASHRRHQHIQEVIVQPFRAKQDTGMSGSEDASSAELEWTIMVAVHMLAPVGIPVQTPPNLSLPHELQRLLSLGVADFGGISPVTPDFVNPEKPWPQVQELRTLTEACGHRLAPRLPVYPKFCTGSRSAPEAARKWLDPLVVPATLRLMDSEGLARREEAVSSAAVCAGWSAGSVSALPPATDRDRRFLPGGADYSKWKKWEEVPNISAPVRRALQGVLFSSRGARGGAAGRVLRRREIETLLRARGADMAAVCLAADELRRRTVGGKVSYAVVRNINYTNMCYFKCTFCAFSKGKHDLRGEPYNLGLDEIRRRVTEAWQRGATEVCLQGGIHPDYTGDTYLGILKAIKEEQPGMHVHAFSPLEVSQGAATLGLPVREYLQNLKDAGLGSLPGTAAEVLDDEVRAQICPDKLSTREWLDVVQAAHEVGLKTTSTLMFGHLEGPAAISRHLVRLRALQQRTRGFTEFVPLPFVHNQAPMYLKGESRQGPSLREAVLVHAVARLALHPEITNIQASWVKMGPQGVAILLQSGVNDLGGTLMDESISRAAGAVTGTEMTPAGMHALVQTVSSAEDPRSAYQRTTLYKVADETRVAASFNALPLAPKSHS